MFRFLTTYKYFPRHPLFLQSIFHGSIASYPNLSLLLPWFVLFSSKKKTFSSLICLLLGSSIKRVSPHVHVAMAPSQTHTALKRYWTFQRWYQNAETPFTCWVLLPKFSIQNKESSSLLLTHVRCLLFFEIANMTDICGSVLQSLHLSTLCLALWF
jgi:hypothetical protein